MNYIDSIPGDFDDVKDPIVTRFTFHPERASEFLDDGRLVTQIECENIEEVMMYVTQFQDALVNANAIVNGQVVNLSDFTESA